MRSLRSMRPRSPHLLPQPPVNLLTQLGAEEAGCHLQLLVQLHQVEHHGGAPVLTASALVLALPAAPPLAAPAAGGRQAARRAVCALEAALCNQVEEQKVSNVQQRQTSSGTN